MKTKAIKKWLIDKDYSQAMIARDLGRSRQLVSKTINGKECNGSVIRWLLDHGCPEDYLDRPRPARRTIKKTA